MVTRIERKAAKAVAEALYEKLTEALPDTIQDCDEADLVEKILSGDNEDFYEDFENLVFAHIIKFLGGKVK